MQRCLLVILLLVVSKLLLGVCSAQSPTMPTAGPRDTNIVSVNASTAELAKGYLRWIHAHPEVQSASPPGAGAEDKPIEPYAILWPTLDIYDADGISIYHGNGSAANITVIRALPQQLPERTLSRGRALRPTLDEAEAMFPEIVAAKVQKNLQQVTAFVIEYSERPACREQDAAVQELKKRLAGSRIKLVEVRLMGN